MKKPESQYREDPRRGHEDEPLGSRHNPRLPDAREVLRLCRAEVLGQGMAEKLF